MFEFYSFANLGLYITTLFSIRSLLCSNKEVKQNHRMLLIYLATFTYPHSVCFEVVYWVYAPGYDEVEPWQTETSIDSFIFVDNLAFFILNQFFAYLMLTLGNPKDRS